MWPFTKPDSQEATAVDAKLSARAAYERSVICPKCKHKLLSHFFTLTAMDTGSSVGCKAVDQITIVGADGFKRIRSVQCRCDLTFSEVLLNVEPPLESTKEKFG